MAGAPPLPEEKLPAPDELLRCSENMLDEHMSHLHVLGRGQAVASAQWQHHNPQVFRKQLRARTPHIAQRKTIQKRSLNSWMAFRSFYQNLFPFLQQKEASTYITTLWSQDPFKAKWTIIAAAYTKIRDMVGKPRAPLETYLKLVCPQIGIIGINDYLNFLNWKCETTVDGCLTIRQTSTPDLQALSKHVLHTSMSERDVIHFCGSIGYILRGVAMRITGAHILTHHQVPQHGMLASAPVLPPTASYATPPSSNSGHGIQHAAEVENELEYPWTGSMSDLYHPAAGSIDFDRLLKDTQACTWDTANIYDPTSLDALIQFEGLQDGFLLPPGSDSFEQLYGQFNQ